MTRRPIPRSPGLSGADPLGLDRVRRLPLAPEPPQEYHGEQDPPEEPLIPLGLIAAVLGWMIGDETETEEA